MGGGRWDDTTWKTYSSSHVRGKSTSAIFTKKVIEKEYNPVDISIRESRDSVDNPQSNAIIVALDVTGSMGFVLDGMIRTGLPTLATEIYSRKPVSDPHIMFMGVGDVEAGDQYPLQVTQFEADIRIAEQLKNIVIEKGGGGNSYESYQLPWIFGGLYTSIDCLDKRNKKGYLFTVGDELPPRSLNASNLKKVFKDSPQETITLQGALALANRMYNVYHVVVEEGDYARNHGKDKVYNAWVEVLGQNVLRLSDHTKLAEVVVSAMQLREGVSKEEVLSSWDGSTAMVLARALGDGDGSVANVNSVKGVVTFT